MNEGTLSAGVGRSCLTPALGTRLLGFAGRASGCTSVHDDLFATALVLDNGHRQIAWLSCDLLSVHPDIVAQVRELVEAATGIPRSHLMICCTHTHSGPPAYAAPGTAALDRAYVGHLPYVLASAVRLAHADLQPARLGDGVGSTDIAINRRQLLPDGRLIIGEHPDGPHDPVVGVLRIDRVDAGPLATVVNVACHPVILGPASLAVSADFVGRTRALVEATTGAPMLFVQGACGDINPRGGVQDNYANCHRLGGVLAGEILRVHASIWPSVDSISLTAARREISVPLRPLPVSMQEPIVPHDSRRVLDEEFPWDLPVTDGAVSLEVQAFGIGRLGVVAVGCEPFVETGLACKAASPFAHTFFAGYANGDIGYVPTADVFPLGGYEVAWAYRDYRLAHPVAPEAEALVVEAGRAMLSRVHLAPQERGKKEHQAIYDRLRGHDPSAAREAMAACMKTTHGEPAAIDAPRAEYARA